MDGGARGRGEGGGGDSRGVSVGRRRARGEAMVTAGGAVARLRRVDLCGACNPRGRRAAVGRRGGDTGGRGGTGGRAETAVGVARGETWSEATGAGGEKSNFRFSQVHHHIQYAPTWTSATTPGTRAIRHIGNSYALVAVARTRAPRGWAVHSPRSRTHGAGARGPRSWPPVVARHGLDVCLWGQAQGSRAGNITSIRAPCPWSAPHTPRRPRLVELVTAGELLTQARGA